MWLRIRWQVDCIGPPDVNRRIALGRTEVRSEGRLGSSLRSRRPGPRELDAESGATSAECLRGSRCELRAMPSSSIAPLFARSRARSAPVSETARARDPPIGLRQNFQEPTPPPPRLPSQCVCRPSHARMGGHPWSRRRTRRAVCQKATMSHKGPKSLLVMPAARRGRSWQREAESAREAARHGPRKVTIGDPGDLRGCPKPCPTTVQHLPRSCSGSRDSARILRSLAYLENWPTRGQH